MRKLPFRSLAMILLLAVLISVLSAAQDVTPPFIELNASLPLNVTRNLTVLLSANFSDTEGGFVGNKTLRNLSDGSAVKNVTFSSGSSQTVYLAIPNYSQVTSAVFVVRGESNASFASFPANVSVDVGNNSVKEFSRSGILNGTEAVSNFSAEMNEYLADCKKFTAEGCLVPIVLSSDSSGIVEVSGINVTYLLSQSCQVCTVPTSVMCDDRWIISNVTTTYGSDYLSGFCFYYWNTTKEGDDYYNVSFRMKDVAFNNAVDSKTVFLDKNAPTLTYLHPAYDYAFVINNTNFINGSAELTFTYWVRDHSPIGNCSLKFDGEINQTAASVKQNSLQLFKLNISINVSTTTHHNWSIKCSDIFGYETTTDTIRLKVLIKGNFSGETTDLGAVNLSKISNLTFEDVKWGKIKFSRDVNLSGISGVLNIADYVKIFNNSIEVNTTAISALNTTATLILYNLTHTNPRIVRDGAVCPPTICQVVNYSNGTLTFNVTQFSVYSAEEVPPSAGDAPSGGNGGGSSGGGGGGSGGGGVASLASETSVLQAELRAGDSGTFSFKKFGELAVYEIVAEAASEAVNPSITVKEARLSGSVPSPVTEESGKVHKYLSITKSSFENISEATMKFKVNNTWLEGNSIDTASVKISRIEKGSWNALPTVLLGEDGKFTSYKAVTPGFSTFAITGNFKTSQPLNREVSDEVKADETVAQPSKQSEAPPSKNEAAEEASFGRVLSEGFDTVTGRAVSSGIDSSQTRFKPIILAFVALLMLTIIAVRKAKFKQLLLGLYKQRLKFKKKQQ